MLQPDFGQTMLIALVWSALFFLAGMRLVWVAGLAGAAAVGLATAYMLIPHVARRIERFRDPSSGDTFNIDQALESFQRGGWFGRGPGEGTVKRILPESHTDFVFAVAAEEFGIVLCLLLVAVFAFIVLRALRHAMRSEDPFARFAAAGLAILFGLQSAINMAVNLHLMPAKGMTLPFISYGGSSMISLAYGMGMLLALTRGRPRAELFASEAEARAGRQAGLIASRLPARPSAPSRPPCSAPKCRSSIVLERSASIEGPTTAHAEKCHTQGAPLVLLAAGGTGGHLFPAEALAEALGRRGVTVDLATDDRAERYGKKFPARHVHVIASETVRGRDPLSLARTAALLGIGTLQALRLIGTHRPSAVVGFGGYPTVPPVLAATLRRIPTLIHEQNAVMGRANRLLAPRVECHRDQLCRRARARAEASRPRRRAPAIRCGRR